MAFGTIAWNERVLILRPGDEQASAHPDAGGYLPSPDVGPFDTVVRWEELTLVEPIHPWPALRVRWEPAGGTHAREQVHHPRGPRALLPRSPAAVEAMETFGALVEQLIGWIRDHHPRAEQVISPGWTDLPDVPWERAPGLPEDEPAAGGAYRASGRSRRVLGQRVVARRPRPTVTELLLAWLALSDRKPWRETLREAVLTDDHVYVELWDRSTWRLPLGALTVRLGETASDAVYVFGKRTFLVLTAREGDELTRRLDLLLATREA